MSAYLRDNSVPVSEVKLLHTIRPLLLNCTTGFLNYDWAEGWIREMKRVQNLSPSTIRHRHGALARCFDWMIRKHPEIMAQNPLRLLKRGFASYTEEDTSDLSHTFRGVFMRAEVIDLHFHDLRHEATCRLYEKTKLSDVLISKITGHRDVRMLQRYASLRGSDLAAHLW